MKILHLILAILLGAFLAFGGIMHFVNPGFYFPFIPDFLPKKLINYLSGLLEIVLGIGVFIPTFRKKAAFGIFLLMLVFLPIHIWDLFRESPAIGSHQAAMIRVPIQFLFIFWAWWVWKKSK